jgi:hypothetical protein
MLEIEAGDRKVFYNERHDRAVNDPEPEIGESRIDLDGSPEQVL